MKRVFLLFCFLGLLGRPPVAQPAATPVVHQADVIVYGGTSAAVIAAVQVARLGKTVLLVSPDTHLGGLSSGGLGFTDTGDKSVIGGLARSFYHRLYLHYQQDSAWRWQARSEYGNKGQSTVALDSSFKTMWIFEPHVAEQIFEQLVAEHRITVHRNTWLDRSATGVQRRQNKLQAFRATNGALYRGRMFIDATYEGDLMAAAGVQYHVGREANSTYGEQWNGVQTRVFQHDHYFKYKIDPYKQPGNPASGLLPEISAEPPGAYGSADKRLQAYCFRVCMSSHPDNRLPFPKPANYDSNRYELLLRLFAAGYRDVFSKFDPIPNRKTDTNNHGPFSFDFIGGNYAYPEASYEERQKIIAAHTTYQLGLLYFLQNDERVPAEIRQRMQQYGLPKDEFKDNGGWPHQLYIREARRMVGQFVMKEADALGTTRIERPIGMGSYTLDSHNTQRYVESDGTVQNEGDIGVKPLRPYSIDYGAILPKEEQCANLLVPVCVSSSHIAYGSIRMEPVFMILGQSAATAAVLALEKRTSPQRLPYPVLAAALLKDGQILQQ
ncbi:MAG: FAD-dependent oxidoreductase [Chitinophagaceae bacterium]|nr:FAD-dependent oxidoreductase [Chitinophagaceae bacterium]